MFWTDKLLENKTGDEWINDAWTPSGIVHMGGLKGPIIHDTLYRVLKSKNVKVKWTFGFDDFDPIDGLPPDLHDSHAEFMGVPIFMAPAPEGDGSFGDFYGDKMRFLFKELGVKAEIYKASDYYKKGVYDEAIKIVLDNAADVRKVYEKMYKKEMKKDWYPFHVICIGCKKLGTTIVTDWDGEEVTYVCSPDLVKWAKGCGKKGKVSPFGGNGKMPFKVEWAAKWWTFGVTIEGAGKDHASAGGTYDVARKICRDVFKKEPPLKIPYEFFLSDGRKMSSSKGLGLTGEDLLLVLDPSVVRFLMIKSEPNRAIEFNPFGTDIIPKLYDDFQKAGELLKEQSSDDSARAFALSQVSEETPPSIRFSVLSQWVQMPDMKEEIKKNGYEKWAKYARYWIEKFAPESEKFLVQEQLPEETHTLTEKQKEYLHKIASELEKDWAPENFQKEMYDWGKELGLSSKETFSAIYKTLLGKDHGPRAAWIILSLDRKFVINRFSSV